jgi:hypothetical protein
MRRRIRHAPSATRWAEATALTREGDDAVEPAFVAVHAHEAVGEYPAAQERSELALDKAGCRALKSTAAGQEALQLTPDGAVELSSDIRI